MKAKRAYLTKKEKAERTDIQGGLCFVFGCDQPIAIWEHWTPVAMGNDQKPDCGLCKGHAAEKTKRDIANIAKVKRIQKKARGETRKKKQIPSRGFQKGLRKKMDGTVERKR